MKSIFKIAMVLLLMAGCSKINEEVVEMNLARCLEPMNLGYKISEGKYVSFSWDLVKDCEEYTLVISSKPLSKDNPTGEMTLSVPSGKVPYPVTLQADNVYYFAVRAISSTSGKGDSKWAVYDGSVKTYAVKDPLNLTVVDRTSTSLTVSWDQDDDVTHLTTCISGSDGEEVVRQLSAEEILNAQAAITGLNPSVNYIVKLYFNSANCGSLSLWTRPGVDGAAECASAEAILQAIADGASKILVKSSDKPYEIGVVDVKKPFSMYGEESVEGVKPVLNGELHITADYSGGPLYFEAVEFNGVTNTYGFAIQLKNGGAAKDLAVESIIYKNCNITGYSKGLIYEWGQTMVLGELTYDACNIYKINADGSGGGDCIDFRGASTISALKVINNVIYTGMRTFIRFDAAVKPGEVKVTDNTICNLCFVENTNNGGLFGVKVAPTGGIKFENNLILNMNGKSSIIGPAEANLTASDAGLACRNNWYYSIADPAVFFNAKVSQAEATAGGGQTRDGDPCFNSKGGVFNLLSDSDAASAGVGAPQCRIPYEEKPEDLTLVPVVETKVWDFTDARYFIGDVTKSKVRDNLLMAGTEGTALKFQDGVLVFQNTAPLGNSGVPKEGYIAFKVNAPGSVYLKPVNFGKSQGSHVVIAVGNTEGTSISIKGGAAVNTSMENNQKILINDIVEESIVYLYPSAPIGLAELSWATDTTQVNTALRTPEVTVKPEKVNQGEGTPVSVSWNKVSNAGSYSVVFNGKSYPVGDTSFEITGDVIKFLDAGSYNVSVYANPGEKDIYNTQSSAGKASFAVLSKGGGGETELVVKSVQELLDAIASGKTDVTLAYNSAPYELGTLALTTPLRLKGQASDGSYPTVKGNVSLSGINGSVIFTNINFEGTGSAEAVIKEIAAVTADTVAVIGGVIRNYSKALYDNSGKQASAVQYLLFDNVQVYDCSNGADFIDMRAGAYHNVKITRSTFARSARTFIRTDAGSEINNLDVRNNTFYKVCTNSTSKDNNGLFHVRGTAGSGMQQFRIQNNLFYSILIPTAPENANGYPKFISKNSAAIKPNSIMNNYFWSIQEDGDYSWWTVNCSKEEGTAAGGAVLVADPCKDAGHDDFTLTNGVAIDAGIGDPRWNPSGGGTPSSQITVENVNDMLTAISAGKTAITLAEGSYDLTAVESVSGGVLEVATDLNLIGKGKVTFTGAFKPTGSAVRTLSFTGIDFNGGNSLGNFIDVSDKTVNLRSVSIKNGSVCEFKNRIYSQSAEAQVASLSIENVLSSGMGTGGDCIDIRKGAMNSIRVFNSTFYNGIRTFLRVDAAVVCQAITVKNNTFYNNCYVDSKDNNGIMHVRSSTMSSNPAACRVESNIFASMHRASASPAQANGFPKIISTASQAIFEPTFKHNYYYDIDTDAGYSWWNTLTGGQEGGCAGYGVVLDSSPFADAASGDFTLTNALAISENVGDQRWNPTKGGKTDDQFPVNSVDEMLTAMAAGKTNLLLSYGIYDLTSIKADNIDAGILTVSSSLSINGKPKDGKYPEMIGAFKIAGTDIKFSIGKMSMNGNKVLGNMIDLDASASISSLTLRDCNIGAYSNRLLSQSGASVTGLIDFSGLTVKNMGTSGDCIDIRKGSAAIVKISNSTFYDGIRTFLRIDAAVACGSVEVKNNTFYNLCSVDSKDNNGIMHVRSSSLSASAIKVEKNIFAAMHRASSAPAQANGFPKLVSTASQKLIEPTFRGNLYYDIDTDTGYSWWNTLSAGEATGTADGGAVLEESPFSSDPSASGKFTVKPAYKGYGDLRW